MSSYVTVDWALPIRRCETELAGDTKKRVANLEFKSKSATRSTR
ncbi:hypothetical protein RESH_05619 [Rhodopirellula europaea SH398]|uniref:Uncharacterized protein n=1 Tax=Rhodopirellula europaea SH398 TaxID=1263868 RepID=M5RWQ2_9BACT|nr:hypothetical protein RESH_05619 [Rhodopirellula europaea SH398]